jgi:hypothetical protein
MYTNIPQDECIESVYNTILNDPSKLYRNRTHYHPKAIKTLLSLVLHNNFFQFNGTFYHQKHGIAMGTPCACTISDIFICNLVQNALNSNTNDPKPLLYKQYRDDGFGIWTHGETKLLEFLSKLNLLHPNIKFTINYGKQIDFLDATITINQFNIIHTETFYKETSTFNYLHPNSNHPSHCKENIAISQTIRHVRICSDFNSFLYHKHFLEHNLRTRGYDSKIIKRKTNSIKYKNRTKYLQYKNNKQKTSNRIPLITTYNNLTPNLNHILNKNLAAFNKNQKTHITKPILAYKVLKNIGSRIIRAKYPIPSTK